MDKKTHSVLPPRELILASASPRRRELLSTVGIPLSVCPSEAEELLNVSGKPPSEVCLDNARSKAEEVALRAQADALVLGADTIVIVDDEVLGKPKDEGEACKMLAILSNRVHEVNTGFVLLEAPRGRRVEQVVRTEVEFKRLEEFEIAAYVRSGEPFDKAGGYGIQGPGAFLVRRIRGSYTNVVGLPLTEVIEAIESLGGPPPFAEAGS